MPKLSLSTLQADFISDGKKPFQRHLLEKALEDIKELIMGDIKQIQNNQFKANNISDVINPIKEAIAHIRQIGSFYLNIQESMLQQVRYLLLVISLRAEQIIQDNTQLSVIQEELALLKQDIGTVPCLNSMITLPINFLPPNYIKSATIGTSRYPAWSNTLWIDPNRNSTKERLEFFMSLTKNKKIAAVRQFLMSEDTFTYMGKDEALSYADGNFYAKGDLQADHLQPAENIVYRQKEMIAAMNIEPLFANNMLKQAENEGYFVKRNGVIFGTKKFFLEYHNDVGNLWLISTAANTGQGKGSNDPIEWLNNHPLFGDNFFNSEAVGGKNSLIKDKILLQTQSKQGLAEAAREWFKETYKADITHSGYMRQKVTLPLQQRMKHITRELEETQTASSSKIILKQLDKSEKVSLLNANESEEVLRKRRKRAKKESLHILVQTAVIGNIAQSELSSSSSLEIPGTSSSELASSDIEINEKNLSEVEITAKQGGLDQAINSIKSSYILPRRSKRRRK